MGTFAKTCLSSSTLRPLHSVAYKLAQRLMTLDVTHLMRLDHGQVTPRRVELAGIVCRRLTPDEVRHFAEPQNELTPDLAERIELGCDVCFAALSGNRLAGYAWYAIGSIEAEHNRGTSLSSGVAMSFPDDIAFMYKGFTHPEFRGRGLYGYVNASALEELQTRGVSTVISTADWTNWSALDCCWRLGYQDLGLVWRAGWGRLMFTRAPRRGKLLGIKFGRNALVQSRTKHRTLPTGVTTESQSHRERNEESNRETENAERDGHSEVLRESSVSL